MQDSYLSTEVKTAAPQKLQLMLVETALRLANRARQFWQEGRNERALQAIIEAQAVMVHMLGVIDREAGGDLAKRVSAVYEFIFRSLVKAGQRHDEKSLGDAVRILEIERETWRQVCDKLAVNSPHADFHEGHLGSLPHLGDLDSLSQQGGFSVEA